jgi:DNA polymerase-3 subunit gamma/tau
VPATGQGPVAEPAIGQGPVAEPAIGQGPVVEPAGAGGLDAAAVRRVWPAVLDEVRERSRVTQALLSGATVHAVDGDTLVFTIGTAALARQLAEERHVEKITDALRGVLGGNWRIRCEQAKPAGQRQQAQRSEPAGQQRPARRIEPPARTSTVRNGRGSAPPVADEPPPPEPPDEPDDEDAMLAEAATPPEYGTGERRDLDEAALELVKDQLGARKIDER